MVNDATNDRVSNSVQGVASPPRPLPLPPPFPDQQDFVPPGRHLEAFESLRSGGAGSKGNGKRSRYGTGSVPRIVPATIADTKLRTRKVTQFMLVQTVLETVCAN